MKPTIFFLLFFLPFVNAYDSNIEANLIYQNTSFANHEFIKEYNDKIIIDSPPDEIDIHNQGIIQNAWFDIFRIEPSILYKGKILVNDTVKIKSDYEYTARLPNDYNSNNKRSNELCKIDYSLFSKNEVLTFNEDIKPKSYTTNINTDTSISANLNIKATTKADYYYWDKYCCFYSEYSGQCLRYCYECTFKESQYNTDRVKISKEINLTYYEKKPEPEIEFITRNKIKVSSKENLQLDLNNSYYKDFNYNYETEFTPYNFLQLKAIDTDENSFRNLIKDNNTLYIKDTSECSYIHRDHFTTQKRECPTEIKGETIQKFREANFTESWNLFFSLIVFVFANVLIYIAIKKSWGKVTIPFLVLFAFIPNIRADECSLSNLASCIPEKLFDFTLNLINAPLQPLLTLARTLLENPPSIAMFGQLWAIIVYCLSMFYGLLFIYSGFQFLFSGHNPIRREMAKDWLKNTVIMIILIQASFYLYKLTLELGSTLTASVLSMVNEQFFLITADNIINVGLEFIFGLFYVIALICTIFYLVIRYLVVCFGVVFVPIGIFCYFIPPLKSYGKLIINILLMFVFITFLDAIVILACSMLTSIAFFDNFKILIMIATFTIINTIFTIMIIHVITKSSMSDAGDKITQATKYIATLI